MYFKMEKKHNQRLEILVDVLKNKIKTLIFREKIKVLKY